MERICKNYNSTPIAYVCTREKVNVRDNDNDDNN